MRQFGFIQLLTIMLTMLLGLDVQAQNKQHDSGYSQLLQALDGYSPEQRADFARIALNKLSKRLHQQAQQARKSTRGKPEEQQHTYRWAASVDRYAYTLSAQANRAEGTSIHISIDDDNNALLRVGEHAFMITSPDPDQQTQLEHDIVQQFCSFHRCGEAGDVQDLFAQVGQQANTRWNFHNDGPSCRSDDGILLQFTRFDHLGRKRKACQKLTSELLKVLHSLTRLQKRGTLIEIDQLSILNRSVEGEITIILNRQDQTVQLKLPALSMAPSILTLAKPWLQARIQGQTATLLVDDAEALTRHLIEEIHD